MNFLATFLYDLGLQFYSLCVTIASLWDQKAMQWKNGRKNLFRKIRLALNDNEERIWFHCASVGEFEQARPVMEAYRIHYPSHKIVLTFFSPSGYELRKNYAGADYIFYLPLDTASNANKLISLFQPLLAVFTKYEFWFHHLKELRKNDIPVILICGIFRKNQLFFKWYGKTWSTVLHFFSHILVQDQSSCQLLRTFGLKNVEIVGDTRFDRVWQIAQQKTDLPAIERFKEGDKLFVAGSTWKADERLIKILTNRFDQWKWVIVPHETDSTHLTELKGLFPLAVFYSQLLTSKVGNFKILIVDEVGLLSSIYRYADMGYIGGGFGKGIHNVLEAAVYGIPIIFGPNHQKFIEAADLLKSRAAKSIKNAEELSTAFENFAPGASGGERNKIYFEKNKGATEKIMNYIKSINSDIAALPG